MKKQSDSKNGYSKKELIKIIEKIDRDRHHYQMKNQTQAPNKNSDNKGH